MYYNRFRYYDPNTGNYISQDPIGLAGDTPTLYAFVSDINIQVDILGLLLLMLYIQMQYGIRGNVGSFGSQKGGLHSEPQILNQMGNQKRRTFGDYINGA